MKHTRITFSLGALARVCIWPLTHIHTAHTANGYFSLHSPMSKSDSKSNVIYFCIVCCRQFCNAHIFIIKDCDDIHRTLERRPVSASLFKFIILKHKRHLWSVVCCCCWCTKLKPIRLCCALRVPTDKSWNMIIHPFATVWMTTRVFIVTHWQFKTIWSKQLIAWWSLHQMPYCFN